MSVDISDVVRSISYKNYTINIVQYEDNGFDYGYQIFREGEAPSIRDLEGNELSECCGFCSSDNFKSLIADAQKLIDSWHKKSEAK